MRTEVVPGHLPQHEIGIAANRQSYPGVPLAELGRIAIDLDHVSLRNKLLPVEPGLLQSEPAAKGHQHVSLLQQDVGITLAPDIGAPEVQGMIRGNAVRGVPGDHQRHACFGQPV